MVSPELVQQWVEEAEQEVADNRFSQCKRSNTYIIGAGFSASLADMPLMNDIINNVLYSDMADKQILLEVISIFYDGVLCNHINVEELFNLIEILNHLSRILLDT